MLVRPSCSEELYIANKTVYKTWIRTRALVILGVLTGVFSVLGVLAFWNVFFLAFLIPGAVFGYIFLIVGLSAWRFSSRGGNYQEKVHNLFLSKMVSGKILDVGCGNGHLMARMAAANPRAALTGVDSWGQDWEYSQKQCQVNLAREGVNNPVEFRKASASDLPVELGEFDLVVSCLTFHEVQDVQDKTLSLSQALSRVATGGTFFFLDLFRDTKYYPEPDGIRRAIETAGGQILRWQPLVDVLPLPFPLNHPRVLGFADIIEGKKL